MSDLRVTSAPRTSVASCMSRIAFIFRTDVHAADKSPDSWKGDYPGEIWSNLEQIGALARKHNCRAVLDGGDFFHVKSATKNSHGLVTRIAEIHSAYPCPVYSIEGNHDITYNDLESVERQPLGVLYATGVFRHLRDELFEDGALRVRVVGFPYKSDRDLKELRSARKQPNDSALLAVVHALAGKKPPDHVEEFFGEPVFQYDRLIARDGPDAWMFGHWHRDQGIEQIDGRYFINQGAVSRGSLVRENLERTPKVALVEVTEHGVKVTSIPLVVAPAVDVFDLEKKERRERENAVINQFAEKIHNTVVVDTSADIASNVDAFESEGFEPDVIALTRHYLQLARGQ